MSIPRTMKDFRKTVAAWALVLPFWAAVLTLGAQQAHADWIRCAGTCYESIEACATAICGPNTSCPACDPGGTNNCTSDPSCAPSTNAPAAPPVSRTRLTNPFGEGVTIETLVGRAIRGFLGISGSLALLMFVYGGFMWVTSGGNPEKVKKGKQIFTYAVIGLIVMFGAYAFLTTVINALGSSTAAPTP